MTQAEIDAKVTDGITNAIAAEKAKHMTQAEIDAKVTDGITNAIAAEKAKQSPGRISVEKPKQGANIAPDELLTLFHSVKRKELIELEEESSAYEKRLLNGKERFPTDAQMAKIDKFSVGNHRVFGSSNSLFTLDLMAREEAGYVAYAKKERIQSSLDNSDFFSLCLTATRSIPDFKIARAYYSVRNYSARDFPLRSRNTLSLRLKTIFCTAMKTRKILYASLYLTYIENRWRRSRIGTLGISKATHFKGRRTPQGSRCNGVMVDCSKGSRTGLRCFGPMIRHAVQASDVDAVGASDGVMR
jgi:hypothetical protein